MKKFARYETVAVALALAVVLLATASALGSPKVNVIPGRLTLDGAVYSYTVDDGPSRSALEIGGHYGVNKVLSLSASVMDLEYSRYESFTSTHFDLQYRFDERVAGYAGFQTVSYDWYDWPYYSHSSTGPHLEVGLLGNLKLDKQLTAFGQLGVALFPDENATEYIFGLEYQANPHFTVNFSYSRPLDRHISGPGLGISYTF